MLRCLVEGQDVKISRLALVWLLSMGSSCRSELSFTQSIDRVSFQRVGGTVFSNPRQITVKQVHLDSGSLIDQQVIVKGTVQGASKHGTYVVLADDTARVLVVLI